MYTTTAVASLLLAGSAFASPFAKRQGTSLDAFVAAERLIAAQGVLNNIGDDGASAEGALRGVVLAGPGILNPDYRYSWTRDSALTAHALEEEAFVGNASILSTIQDYVYAESVRQTVLTPLSGLYPWGTGLGEPKYWPNLTRFNGVWGRPQRDGPAVRAIALETWINYLVENDQVQEAQEVVWPVLRNDLLYIAQYWGQIGYDLWEEVAGLSFFTIQSSYRALFEGSQVARALGFDCPHCDSQAPQILCFLQNNFWNATGNHIIANIRTTNPLARTGIDSNYIVSAIENFDIDGSCDPISYQPCSSRMLASHKAYVDVFRDIYPINAGIPATDAVATGRYAEDTYYGGNPWFLSTLGAAELLYDAAAQFRRRGQLTIDNISLAFFQQIYPAAQVGTYRAPRAFGRGRGGRPWGMSPWGRETWGGPSRFGRWRGGPNRPANATSEFNEILTAMTNYADGFVRVVQTYTPLNGSYSEQYNRTTGELESAYDLTWSLASFVTMAQRRNGQYPESWNSRSASAPPGTCDLSGVSSGGQYAAATAAGAPEVDTSCSVQVTFRVNATTTFGQNLYITGNIAPLGNWAPDFDPMSPPYYPIWEAIVDAEPDTTINYKYVYQNAADYTLEAANRTVETGPCGNGLRQVVVNDVFGPTGPVITENFCNPDVVRCEDTAYLTDGVRRV